MCRPRSSVFYPMILGAVATLAIGGCGKGLYTHGSQFHDPDSSGGGVIDPGTGTGTGGGTSTSSDSSSNRTPDAAPKFDAEPGPCETHWVSNGTDAVIPCGDATLIIPKGVIPAGSTYPVTLSLKSNDGNLVLVNGDGTNQDYGGLSGPIYSITADFDLWNTATLKIQFVPDPSIPPGNLGLASVNEASKVWVKTPDATYDTRTSAVSGTVTNPPIKGISTRYFAPAETCQKDSAVETCHLGLKCKGDACQK